MIKYMDRRRAGRVKGQYGQGFTNSLFIEGYGRVPMVHIQRNSLHLKAIFQ